MEDAITNPACPHLRVRVVFDPGGAELADEHSPLVVRLDDQGHTLAVSGWQGHFRTAPLGYAWKHFGDHEKVSRYLSICYGARAEFVTVPDTRSFGWVVIAHPEYVAMFGGEGAEHPGQRWIAQTLAHTITEVTAYTDREAWQVVAERHVTGVQVRTFDDDRGEESTQFTAWEETDRIDGFLTYDWATDQARHYLAGEVLDCKRCPVHGA